MEAMRDRQCAPLNHDAIESAPIVQEHWLPSFDLHRLHNIVSDNVCFASSAMDDVIAEDCLRGRPFGGVAIFVRSHLASTVKLIKAVSRYIMIQVDQTVFVNVYLPCVSSPGREQDILDCLADIINVLDTLNFVNIVFGGDLNVDFDTADHFCGVLLNFTDDLGLRFVFDKVPLDARKLLECKPQVLLHV